MKTTEPLNQALKELQLLPTDHVTKEVKLAHKRALIQFTQKKFVEAYKSMLVILRYYAKTQEDLPIASEKLYKTLILNDIVNTFATLKA